MVRRLAIMVTVVTAAGAALAGCGNFEDPAIVLDLRILSVTASRPEYVIPFDPQNPPDPTQIMLDPSEICALVADPGATRALDWSMTICAAATEGQSADGRCRDHHPAVVFGSGTIDDPDVTAPQPELCAWYEPDASTFVLLQDAIEIDPLAGFSGIDLEVELHVAPAGESLDDGVVAAKRLRFAAQIPVERTPNTNPDLVGIGHDFDALGRPAALPPGRCVDQPAPITLDAGKTIHLVPFEPPGVRETYVVPTFDGGSRTFTENMTYQWLAGDGSFTAPFTGGPRDPFGNDPDLDTDWTAPNADELDGDTLVPLWIVQRDERLGARWFESCVHVHTP